MSIIPTDTLCCVAVQVCPNGPVQYFGVWQTSPDLALWNSGIGNLFQSTDGFLNNQIFIVLSVTCYGSLTGGSAPCEGKTMPFYSDVTNLGAGPCPQPTPTSPTCCVTLTSCTTGSSVLFNIGLANSATYDFWTTNVGNLVTGTDLSYPGTWLVDGICCTPENPGDDICLDPAACILNANPVDKFGTVSVLGEGPCEPPIYTLRDCTNPLNTISTITDLSVYIGMVINIQEEAGCWQVEDSGLTGSGDTVTLTQSFTDCECCLPTPAPVCCKNPNTIPKADRIFYQIAEGQCDIQANIKFANAYYQLYKKLKHGMGNCCDNLDLDKVWLKKELSDMAMITNQSLCTITPAPEPIICPEPS